MIKIQGNKVTPEEVYKIWTNPDEMPGKSSVGDDWISKGIPYIRTLSSEEDVPQGLIWLKSLPQFKINQYYKELTTKK